MRGIPVTEGDPYSGNILIEGLGPIRSRAEWTESLFCLPPRPGSVASIPVHARMHWLMSVRDLHVPRQEELRLAESLDLSLRQGYRYRHPAAAATWATLTREPLAQQELRMPAGALTVVGHSGTGKTEAIRRILGCYPCQIMRHESFPNLLGPHYQVGWISVDVPASGRAVDLAAALMRAWQRAMVPAGGEHAQRFERSLALGRQQGARMLEEWRQVACSHFLGVLHLDEIQNLFKLMTLEQRRKRGRVGTREQSAGLAIVEDQVLKWILSLTNEWGIPLCLSGTPDGIQALKTRFAIGQRLVSAGYHVMRPFSPEGDAELERSFLPALLSYQYVAHPLSASPELIEALMALTAGIPRLLVVLWIAAHRVAFERRDDTLRIEDLHRAAKTYLAPVMPAVQALRSSDPRLCERFEDLLPTGWDAWDSLANPL